MSEKGLVTTTLPDSSSADFAPSAFVGTGGVTGGWGWNSGFKNASPTLFGGDVLMAPTLRSAQREIGLARAQAVANSREVDRNNGPIKGAITRRAVNMVGANLRLQSLPNWKALGLTPGWAAEFAQAFENEFSLWGEDPRALNDAERHYQFGGQMLLAARNVAGPDGECAMILRYDEDRQRQYGARFATFLEVIDPDRIETPDGLADREGVDIVKGRELDRYGAYTALHVRVGHPTDSRRDGRPRWERVLREDSAGRPIGIHWFFKHRAAAQRGMPAILASLRKVKMLDDFDDAQLETAIVNSLLSIFVETESSSEEMLRKLQKQVPAGGSGDPIEDQWNFRFNLYDRLNLVARGSRIPVLPFGDKINMSAVNRASDDTDSFRAAFNRAFASEIGVSYEEFSGDYSESTYAGARQGLITNWRLTVADRHMFTQATGALIALGVLEECVATGKIALPAGAPNFFENISAYAQCNFMGPGMGWVDPLNEVKAAQLRVQEGFSTRSAEASLQGQDYRDIVDQRAADDAYAESRGVAFGPPMPEANDEETEDEKRRKPGSAGGGGQESRS